MRKQAPTLLKTLATLLLVVGGAAQAQNGPFIADGYMVPMRVRDFTFPSFLSLGFAPLPATTLRRGDWAFEMHGSVVNNFQLSQTVEDYLDATRGPDERRGLNQDDVDFILGLEEGQGFYIDGEFEIYEVAYHRGLTDRLMLSVSLPNYYYTGGNLDGSIFDFHDKYGFGQQGRTHVADGLFQIVLADVNGGLVATERPSDGGVGDPSVFLTWRLKPQPRGWRLAVTGGVKPPVADEQAFVSSGSWDFGVMLNADKRWKRNALILNAGLVLAGDYRAINFDPPVLPSLSIAWLHRWKNLSFFIQAFTAEHPLRDVVNSALADLELQTTAGFKVHTDIGVFGLAFTENVANYDNTPDIGLHFSWAWIIRNEDPQG